MNLQTTIYDVLNDYSLSKAENQTDDFEGYKWKKVKRCFITSKGAVVVDVLLGIHKESDELHYLKTDCLIDLEGAQV